MTALIVLALIVVLAAIVVDFVRNGPAPPSELRCATCPKLARQVRAYQVVLVAQLVGWALSLVWVLGRHA